MKMNSPIFSNIRSKDIMKLILSHLKLDKVLNLIKYNKNLQARLDITKKVFENFADPFLLSYKKEVNITKSLYIHRPKRNILVPKDSDCAVCVNSCYYSVYFIYLLIYAILLVAKDGFNESNTETDSQNSINIIDTINKCIFALVGIAIASYIFITFYACKITEDDINCKRYLKIIMMMIFIVIHFAFEVLIIWKLAISYTIKTISITWFMNMDYVFIVFNFLFIGCSLFEFIYYYRKTIPQIKDNTSIILNSINNIMIDNYHLPVNFDTFCKREQRIYICKNFDDIKMVNFSIYYKLFEAIDNQRKKFNISHISHSYENILRDFMLTIPSEAVFYDYKNVFRIADDIYLIRGDYDEIVDKIQKGDKEFLKAICNDKITKCSIVSKMKEKNIKYIFLWGNYESPYINKQIKTKTKIRIGQKGYERYEYKIKDEDKDEYKDSRIDIELKERLEENLIDK